MSQQRFTEVLHALTADIAGRALDADLAIYLNSRYGAATDSFQQLATLCTEGIDAGWLCHQEHGGIKFGRVIKPGAASHGFSVDVVEMVDVVGPHHSHPNGEIDMVIVDSEGAEFDGHGAGWVVYEPGSAHSPTVTAGKAIILYLLPDGALEFSRR